MLGHPLRNQSETRGAAKKALLQYRLKAPRVKLGGHRAPPRYFKPHEVQLLSIFMKFIDLHDSLISIPNDSHGNLTTAWTRSLLGKNGHRDLHPLSLLRRSSVCKSGHTQSSSCEQVQVILQMPVNVFNRPVNMSRRWRYTEVATSVNRSLTPFCIDIIYVKSIGTSSRYQTLVQKPASFSSAILERSPVYFCDLCRFTNSE